MEVEDFVRQSHVLVVLGKGGVGKTTVTAALALAAARAGVDVLVVALDDSGDLPALFGRAEPFGYDEVVLHEGVPGRVRARVLTSRAALLEYLDDHGLRRVSRRLADSGVLEVIATAIPGIEEVLVLGKVKQIERERQAELVVIDAPATGHALSFLTSPTGLADAARGGPLRQQAEQVLELIGDASRCQAVLVALPEETPVNELIETAYQLEDRVGVALGPVVVNGCYPDLDGLDVDPIAAARAAGAPPPTPEEAQQLIRAARFRLARHRAQQEQLERLSAKLPLAQLRLPYLFEEALGPEAVGRLADVLAASVRGLDVAGSDARPCPDGSVATQHPDVLDDEPPIKGTSA